MTRIRRRSTPSRPTEDRSERACERAHEHRDVSVADGGGEVSAVVLADKVPSIVAPSISYHALLPIFIVLGGAMLGVLVEAVVPRKERFATQLLVTFASLIGAGIDVCL